MKEQLFTPIKVGQTQLKHRVVMAPLTRFRANANHVHSKMAITYYKQRASTPGTLLITEACFISPQAGGFRNVPGIWNGEQVAAWKEIIDAGNPASRLSALKIQLTPLLVPNSVHSQGSAIYLQLWALGRGAQAVTLKNEGGYEVVSASNIPLSPTQGGRASDIPRALSVEEIEEYVGWYARAAQWFVQAGGDGVEIHAAKAANAEKRKAHSQDHRYLIDQFTQKNSNLRTDAYGGSVKNRTRFALEVTQAVANAVGADRVGIRLSPHSTFQGIHHFAFVLPSLLIRNSIPAGMKMARPDILETFSYLVSTLKAQHPSLAYVHLTEPRVAGGGDQTPVEGDDLDFLHKIWSPRTVIVAGGFTAESSRKEATKRPNACIAIGRMFISNPDLPVRFREGIALTPYNRKTFYTEGPDQPVGYIDYPFANGSKL
ncbi:NADPH2 dehydrogenase, partial [Phenoliferia sp. Uapishka_3]